MPLSSRRYRLTQLIPRASGGGWAMLIAAFSLICTASTPAHTQPFNTHYPEGGYCYDDPVDCGDEYNWCGHDRECGLSNITNPATVAKLIALRPGGMRQLEITNPASPVDSYYRDVCLTGANLNANQFDPQTSILTNETPEKGSPGASSGENSEMDLSYFEEDYFDDSEDPYMSPSIPGMNTLGDVGNAITNPMGAATSLMPAAPAVPAMPTIGSAVGAATSGLSSATSGFGGGVLGGGSGDGNSSVFSEYYTGTITGSKPLKGSCANTIDTPKFTTPTTGNAAFSHYINQNNASFSTNGDDPTSKNQYQTATNFLGGALGCPESIYSDLDLKTVSVATAANWKKATERCYDYYILQRAAHPEWTLERPGIASDDPLTQTNPELAIFNSCQPLMDGQSAKAVANGASPVGTGFAPVLQYHGRADLDEAEYNPALYLKKSWDKLFPGKPAPAFQSALPCVKEMGIDTGGIVPWAAFNSAVMGSYALVAYIEETVLRHPFGSNYHIPIANDFIYISKGLGKIGYCPNVEKIITPAEEDIFAPRNDYKGTDRDYSILTSLPVIRDRALGTTQIGYSNYSTGGSLEKPEVQCAVVPVDILSTRKDAFDNCMMQRINYNYFSWRLNNFLEYYNMQNPAWTPPCSTKFYQNDTQATCPVKMSIQQCCRIIVKPVVPINLVKIRTCEGLRKKRMDALGYDHIYDGDGISPGGLHISANNYEQAVALNKQLEAFQCDKSEPDDYTFKHYLDLGKASMLASSVPGASSVSSAATGAVGNVGGTGAIGNNISGNLADTAKNSVPSAATVSASLQKAAPALLPSEAAAIKSSMAGLANASIATYHANNESIAAQQSVAKNQATVDMFKKNPSAAMIGCGARGGSFSAICGLKGAEAQLAKSQAKFATAQKALADSQAAFDVSLAGTTKIFSGISDRISTDAANGEALSALNGLQGGLGSGSAPHMPYMRWWDTGTAAGDPQHGGSFINTLGAYDTIVGVGREERTMIDAQTAGKTETQASHIGRIDGWLGLKAHQMQTTRHNNLSCIGRYEKLFKPGSGEDFALSKAGSGYTSQKGQAWSWPLGWRGYINDTKQTGFLDNVNTSVMTGMDNARAGDIIVYTLDNKLKQIDYVTNVSPDPNKNPVTFLQVERWDQGKFKTATGFSNAWGQIKKRTIYKNVPEADRKQICSLKLRALIPESSCPPDIDSAGCISNQCQPSCEDPDAPVCQLPNNQWDQAKIYHPKNDYDQKRWCSNDIATPNYDFNKTYQVQDISEAINNNGIISLGNTSSIPSNIFGYCVNAGFDPPKILRTPEGYQGAGAGTITDLTLCGPTWGSCSAKNDAVATCFPGGAACNSSGGGLSVP